MGKSFSSTEFETFQVKFDVNHHRTRVTLPHYSVCHVCHPPLSLWLCVIHSDIDIGIKQTISKDYADEIEARLLESRKYLKNVVGKDGKLRSLLLDACKLKHELCAFWAVIGECESNPTYMNMNCGPACQSCEQLTYENRCPINLKTMPNAWNPGDLNEFFTSLTTGAEYKQYAPKVLSQEPWVVVLENFVSEQEAKRLIELGYQKGWKQSYDVGKVNPADGSYESRIHQGRTSTTAWCTGTCQDDAVTQTVVQRISNLTNIPETNSEYLQLLKYEKGQAYTVHHDYIAEHKDRQSGVRVMTVYLYLNDDVEEGGGTNFPELNVTVTPKRGRVVLWPSVLDEDPSVRDNRTLHQALPVVRGVKYGKHPSVAIGSPCELFFAFRFQQNAIVSLFFQSINHSKGANAWIHLRDYQTPHQNGCGAVVRHAKK